MRKLWGRYNLPQLRPKAIGLAEIFVDGGSD